MSARAIALALALAGCAEGAPDATYGSRSAPASPLPQQKPPDASPALPAAGSLEGEWRVAGVGGDAIDLPHAITASIDAARIHVVSDCVNLAWDYTLDAGRLTTTRAAAEGCGRGLAPVEERLVAVLDAALTAELSESGGIELRGSGGKVALYRQ